MKIKLKIDTLCAHDVHEVARYRTMKLSIKPPLKAGTILKVTDCIENLFGTYYVCKTERGFYYIPLSKGERVSEANKNNYEERKKFEIDRALVDYSKSLGFEKEGFWGMIYKHNGGALLINVVGGKEVFYNYNKESDLKMIKGASAWDFGLEVIIDHFRERKLEELWIMN